jgi:hypothetical protein
MCARYLVPKGSGWIFQIRVPRDLDSTLATIRLSIGSMPAIPARQRAVLLAAGAQAVFQSVRKMNDSQLQGEDRGQLSKRKIEALLPMLAGLDALTGTSDRAVVDYVFPILALIGHQQATGVGPFSTPGVRHEAPFLAALKSPPIGRAMLGQGNLDDLGDTTSMLNTIENLSERLREGPPAAEKPALGQLFSEVANERIAEIRRNKGDRHETVGTYAKVRDEFIAIAGDRPVGDYYRGDLQKYVDEIAWLPPDSSSRRGFSTATSRNTSRRTRQPAAGDWRERRSRKGGSPSSRRSSDAAAPTPGLSILSSTFELPFQIVPLPRP